MAGYFRFVWLCVKMAFRHHRSVIDIAALTAGILLPLLNTVYRFYGVSGQENTVNDLAWEIVSGACIIVVLVRLLCSPYWVYQETLSRARTAESGLNALDRECKALGASLKEAETRNRELIHSKIIGDNPVDSHEWPALTDHQAEQWINDLRPFTLKGLKISTLPSVGINSLFRSIQKVGRELNIEPQLFVGYPTKLGEFRIQAVTDDPAALKLLQLCKAYTPAASINYVNMSPNHLGDLDIFIGEKPEPPRPKALRIQLDPEHLFDANANGAFYWRVDVISTWHEPVVDCRAYLTNIERNGVEKWGKKKALLTFEPGSAANTCKTITPGATEILDIIASSGEEVIPATWPRGDWPYREQLHTIFEVTGDYVLTIDVEASNVLKTSFQYKFTKNRGFIEPTGINPMPPV